MKKLIFIAIVAGLSGCSTLHESDTAALQGKWLGKEIGGKIEGPSTIVVAQNTAEFRSPNTNEWLKTTFSVQENANPRKIVFVTTDCAYPPHIGIKRYAIYRFEGDMIRLTASEPGDPNMPSDFNTPGTRQFVFRKH